MPCDTVVSSMPASSAFSPSSDEPLPGQRVEAAQPLLHPLEPVRDAARFVDALGALLLLESRDAAAQVLGLILQDEALGVTLLLAAGMTGELGTQSRELVGEQPRSRVPHDGGDRRGLAGDLGLAAERLELAAQLPREIAQPCEVRLHRLELAEGLLLAAAVLEDARGLLDEPAPLLGRGLQDAVEPALADDHVHLATEPRVAQQLLHIQQPADAAVDRILARAVAEERAADRHLGVVDRKRAVAVVDRQLHLGATERAARRGAGEDDVLHLAAAEGLRALLAHHPGEGVDDVRLARAVRARRCRSRPARRRRSSAGRTT